MHCKGTIDCKVLRNVSAVSPIFIVTKSAKIDRGPAFLVANSQALRILCWSMRSKTLVLFLLYMWSQIIDRRQIL